MEIDPTAEAFLRGEDFSNAGRFHIPYKPVIQRNRLLRQLAQSKRVLHVGCADHVEIIEEKRLTGRYLHDDLLQSASAVTGSDTNREALSRMTAFGFTELYTPEELPRERQYDLVLAPDVIEHVPNVREFLLYLASFTTPVVITTPNALRLRNRLSLTHELVNTDHRYWFSPYTLTKSLYEAGFSVTASWYTDEPSLRQPVRSLISRLVPSARDGLAVLAEPTLTRPK